MSSIKECTLAFFKGLAFGKGLIIGRELAENKAWQRQNTPNGVWSAKKVMEELKQFE